MDSETWLNAKKAVELKFADGILFTSSGETQHDMQDSGGLIFSRQAVTNSILSKLPKQKPHGVKIEPLYRRLNLLKP